MKQLLFPLASRRPSRLSPKNLCLPALSLGLLSALILPGLSKKLKIRRYVVHSHKLPPDFCATIALLADYHSGEGYAITQDILHALRQEPVDLLLLGGDFFSNLRPIHDNHSFLWSLTHIAPTFFVTGNHEERSQKKTSLFAMLQHSGITLLNERHLPFLLKDEKITLCGLSDSGSMPTDRENRRWRHQAKNTFASLPQNTFTLLLSHRPEQVALYRRLQVDLILSGHAHGGQWRIPGLINGVFSPNQGILPNWAGGHYDLATGQQMIVSRGLGNHTVVPRIYNPPELVFIEVRGPK